MAGQTNLIEKIIKSIYRSINQSVSQKVNAVIQENENIKQIVAVTEQDGVEAVSLGSQRPLFVEANKSLPNKEEALKNILSSYGLINTSITINRVSVDTNEVVQINQQAVGPQPLPPGLDKTKYTLG